MTHLKPHPFCPMTVLCTVDLTKHKDVSLRIEKVGSDPYCEMKVESLKKTIEVAAGTKASLSFLDCPNEDVRLTASKVISKMLFFSLGFGSNPLYAFLKTYTFERSNH